MNRMWRGHLVAGKQHPKFERCFQRTLCESFPWRAGVQQGNSSGHGGKNAAQQAISRTGGGGNLHLRSWAVIQVITPDGICTSVTRTHHDLKMRIPCAKNLNAMP